MPELFVVPVKLLCLYWVVTDLLTSSSASSSSCCCCCCCRRSVHRQVSHLHQYHGNSTEKRSKSVFKIKSNVAYIRSNVQRQFFNNRRLSMDIRRTLKVHSSEWPQSLRSLHFLSGCSKCCTECSSRYNLSKRSRPDRMKCDILIPQPV